MPPKAASKPVKTLTSFFTPIRERNVDEEHKVLVKRDVPVVEESKRKRPKTAKKAPSLSATLRLSHPWAIAIAEPDPTPFTAIATDSETDLTGPVEFRERDQYPLQMYWEGEMVEVDIENIILCDEDLILGECFLCREKYDVCAPLWECGECKAICCESEMRVWHSWLPRCPKCRMGVTGFPQRFECSMCDSDSLLGTIGLYFSGSRRGANRKAGGQLAQSKTMKQHEGTTPQSFHKFVSRLYQFVRLNNKEVLDAVYAKQVKGYLSDSRVIDAIRSEVHPPYTEDMRKDHIAFLENYVKEPLVAEHSGLLLNL